TIGAVPGDCALVVVAGPADPLLAREVDALNAYVTNAGRMFVLSSPLSRADPNPLLSPWGVHFTGGVVVDPDRSQDLDVEDVIAEEFPSANAVDRGVSRLQLPVGGALIVDVPAGRTGLTVSRLAQSS